MDSNINFTFYSQGGGLIRDELELKLQRAYAQGGGVYLQDFMVIITSPYYDLFTPAWSAPT